MENSSEMSLANGFQNSGFQSPPYLSFRLSSMLEKIASLYSEPKIYDFGCGYGGLTYYLTKNFFKNFSYKAYDPDKLAESFCKKLFEANYKKELKKFDIIFTFGVLELLNEDAQKHNLIEFKEMLLPEGRIIVEYNVFNKLNLRWIIFLFLGLGNPIRYHEKKKFHRTYLTLKEVEKLFHEAGYNIESWAVNNYYFKLPVWLDNFLLKILKRQVFYSTIFYVLKPK